MSYDIYLNDPQTGDAIKLASKQNLRGGTYALGGTPTAWLNVTYNYAPFFYRFLDSDKGIRVIYGLTGAQSIPLLEAAISKMKGEPSQDYWADSEGNAKKVLEDLLTLAKMAPHGKWDGD